MRGQASDELGERIGAYWDERAPSYSNGVVGELSDGRCDPWERLIDQVTYPALEAALDAGRAAKALDLGCGPGFFEVILTMLGWEVAAVDGSASMLERARANVEASCADARVTFVHADFARLPFDDATFDVALSRNVTWLMRDPEATYAEWLRVLRPGGLLLVFDANWYRYLTDPEVAARREADQATNVLVGYDEDSMATDAEERRCEELAAELPLTPVARPAWDREVLVRLGVRRVETHEDAWRTLWPEDEQRFYGATPLFFVLAER